MGQAVLAGLFESGRGQKHDVIVALTRRSQFLSTPPTQQTLTQCPERQEMSGAPTRHSSQHPANNERNLGLPARAKEQPIQQPEPSAEDHGTRRDVGHLLCDG